MTFFEKEIREFFNKETLIGDKVFNDKTLIGRLNDKINVKVELRSGMYADHYYGFRIELINKETGVIDSTFIEFASLWGKFKLGPNMLSPHIWVSNGDAEWYGFQPTLTNKKQITKAIDNYIALYV